MGLITFITSFISLFVSIIPEPILDESPFTNFLPIILSFDLQQDYHLIP